MSEQITYYGNELYHYGAKGQKWGTRRYQNEDGSLTEEGRIHYGYGKKRYSKKEWKMVKNHMRDKQIQYSYSALKKLGVDKEQKKLDKLKGERNIYNKANRYVDAYDPIDENGNRQHSYIAKGYNAYTALDRAKLDAKISEQEKKINALEDKGRSIVNARMTKEFKQSYADWNKEQNTKAAIGTGIAMATPFLALGVMALAEKRAGF